MLSNYIKVALRNLLKYKIYSFINIVGLAVGLACTLFILLWVQDELSYDRFHENAERIHRVAFTYRPLNLNRYHQPGALASYLKQNYPEIEQATFVFSGENKLSYRQTGFFERGMYVQPDFLTMFSFPLIRGSQTSALADPNSILITAKLSKKIFGTEDPLGKALQLNDRTQLTIMGVLEDIPHNTHLQFDYLIPAQINPGWMQQWDSKSGFAYVMLRKASDEKAVNQKIAGIMDRTNPTWENTLFLQPLTRDHLYPVYGQGVSLYIYIFSSVAIIILLIACINFMNLSTARSEKRSKEIGIRKTLGCKKGQLAKQFLIESILFSLIAMCLALLTVEVSLPLVNRLLNLQLQVHVNWTLIGGLILMIVTTGFIAGSYPALHLASLQPQQIFKPLATKSSKRFLVRRFLVTTQFSLSILFIICMLTINRQLDYINNKDLGFTKEHLVMLQTQGTLRSQSQIVKNRLMENPQIVNVAVSDNDLLSWTNSGPVQWEGMPEGTQIEIGYNWVDYDFSKTLDTEMIEGRFFNREYTTDKDDAYVVNEAAVKLMGLESPIGKEITAWFGRKGKIIGVIKNYHTATLHENIQPFALILSEKQNFLCIRIKPDRIAETLQDIEGTVKSIVPDDPVRFTFLDETIHRAYQIERRSQMLILFSAVLAVFVSCLGLYGLALFMAEQRTKEIGVRKILGASVANITAILAKDFTRWILIANLIAWPIAWFAMNKWLQNFAYRIEIGWWVFAIAGGIALVIALLTVSWQAIRSATANPVEALRYE